MKHKAKFPFPLPTVDRSDVVYTPDYPDYYPVLTDRFGAGIYNFVMRKLRFIGTAIVGGLGAPPAIYFDITVDASITPGAELSKGSVGDCGFDTGFIVDNDGNEQAGDYVGPGLVVSFHMGGLWLDGSGDNRLIIIEPNGWRVPLAVSVADNRFPGASASSQIYDPALFNASPLTCTFLAQTIQMGEEFDGIASGSLTIVSPDADGFLEYRDVDGNNPIYNKDSGIPNYTLEQIVALD